MKRTFPLIAILFLALSTTTALAAQQTVTLAVQNMYCPSCPYIVQKSLLNVPGVTKAKVSSEKKTAVVTFDDAKTSVAALTHATTQAGYPSSPKK
ncbi:mercury resistance system periplasmic binding protein MerP [Varunaivibrio sulfuroxidans]|uniref:Periplasmic mercury ion-binding protein n=1 Tax=Varunaivibrio sulfuroxidans TaxID=1773489 RepID=A0A4R3JE56_9PROT|nr:mercury resistance system periplasmic binding protein MerP [Varunaivibrio sulfuroxidans]TCS62960.1 mercuric ion binding protein [Varunaivibrio sulfuroxidans]WES31962.1 mercury resistance system periplasmic binding protein MerP [Varunaivibrio sulfuroxidans]